MADRVRQRAGDSPVSDSRDGELAVRLAELSKREQRDQATTELGEWLVLLANGAELTPKPRRKAA